MPYDDNRSSPGAGGNVRVLLMMWLLAAGVAGFGVMMIGEGNRAVGAAMIAAAVVTVVGGAVLVHRLSARRTDRQG
jgi:hypothetical protein